MSRAVLLLLALVGALLAAGCGGGGAQTAASGPPQTKAEYQATVSRIVSDVSARYGNLSVDPAKPVKPSAIKAKVGKFEIAKVEATLSGTVVAGEKDALTLVAASGAKYSLTSCGDCPSEAEKLVQVRAWAKEGKPVKISGAVGECCEGALSLAVAKAELAAPKN